MQASLASVLGAHRTPHFSRTSEGHKELAAKSARIAADAEAGAAAAGEKASVAKDRIERLAKGEDVSGGLGKPMTRKDYEKRLRDAGWSAADIRFSIELDSLRGEAEFEAFVQQCCELTHRAEKSSRWKVLRQIRANRGRDGYGRKGEQVMFRRCEHF
jgi:hypothetical protein